VLSISVCYTAFARLARPGRKSNHSNELPAVKGWAKIFEAVNQTAFTDREPGSRARLNWLTPRSLALPKIASRSHGVPIWINSTVCLGRWYFQTTREISICLIDFKRIACNRRPVSQIHCRHILTATSINNCANRSQAQRPAHRTPNRFSAASAPVMRVSSASTERKINVKRVNC